ncbi:hypothetical protein J3B02_003977, partial [Coemansia erecta]
MFKGVRDITYSKYDLSEDLLTCLDPALFSNLISFTYNNNNQLHDCKTEVIRRNSDSLQYLDVADLHSGMVDNIFVTIM